MNPADFTTVSYKFKLYDAAGADIESHTCELQYLDTSTQEWTTFHRYLIADSNFFFEEEINPAVGTPHSFFLQDNDIPEMRVIPIPAFYTSTTTTEVLAFACELTTDEVAGTLEFNFGTLYLVEEAELPSADVFTGFTLVTSPFLSVNQSANLALIADLEATIIDKDEEIDELTTTIATRDATIATRDATIATQTTTIATRDATIATQTATIATRDATIATQTTTIATRDATIVSLNAEIDEKDATIAALTTTVDELNTEIEEKDATIVTLNTTITALNTEITVNEAVIASLNAQVLAALVDVQEQTLKVSRLEELKAQLESKVVDKEEQIEILQEQIDIDSTPVRVSDLYQQLVQEVDTASKGAESAYKLTNISLKLKTLVSRDAEGVNAQLFDFSAMNQVNGDAVSEIVFDIAPSTTPASGAGSVPNLLGLTETAVRRILTSLDLRLNPVFQNNTQVVNGDSFKQSPEEGSSYNTNDSVTVIFSKHE